MVWLILNTIFILVAFVSFWYGFWVIGLVFVLLSVSTLWTWRFGAAWDPTPMRIVKKIFDLVDLKENDVIYDLGCGDGRLIIEAVKRYNCRAVGVELDPLRYLITLARVKLMKLDDRIEVIWGNIFKQNLRNATVVFCFLTQETNTKLEEKLTKELPYGTLVISYIWRFPSLRLINVIDDEVFIYLI